jgi:hypothetical protein
MKKTRKRANHLAEKPLESLSHSYLHFILLSLVFTDVLG